MTLWQKVNKWQNLKKYLESEIKPKSERVFDWSIQYPFVIYGGTSTQVADNLAVRR